MRRSPHTRPALFCLLTLASVLATPLRGAAPGAVPPRRNTPPALGDAIFLPHERAERPIYVTLSLDLRDRAGAEALTGRPHEFDRRLPARGDGILLPRHRRGFLRREPVGHAVDRPADPERVTLSTAALSRAASEAFGKHRC